ncbi:MAG: hypothetical protein JNK58_00005, partial [Phycisphaerae bacterium]|nr:hypothetical protein [Phycisphaerae bacterium]
MSLRLIGCGAVVLAAGSVMSLPSAARGGVPIDASWLNAADGFWGTPGNWDIGAVPNNMGMTEYNAFITVGGAPYNVDLDLHVIINNLTIDSPLGEATLRLNGFNLTLIGGLSASNSNLILGDGVSVITLEAGSVSTTSGVEFMNVGHLFSRGNITYAGAGDEFCDTDVDHEGTTTISGPGTVALNNGSVFRVTSTGLLNLNNSNSINTAMGGGSLVNDGTILRGVDGATFTIDGVPLSNNGTIRVASGALAFSGGGAVLSNAGTLEIEASRTLELVSGATLSNFGAGTLTGGVYNVKGTLRFDTGGTGIDTIDAEVILDGAASAIQNSDTSDALANTGAVTASGSLALKGSRSFTTGGDFDNAGTVAIDPGSTFEVPAGSMLNNFDAGGSRTLSGGRFEVRGTGVLKFDAGAMGIDTIDAELILDAPQGSNPVRNSADGSAIALLDTIGNNGRLELASGFDFTTASSFAVAADGALVLGEGSVFEVPNVGGNQLVNFGGNVIQDGSFEVRGVLRAPGLAVQTIGNVGNPSQIVLDSQLYDGMDPVPHFQDNANNNSDAFSALQTIEVGSSLSLRNGAMLSVTGGLTVRGTLNVSGSGPGPLRGTLLPSSLTIGGALSQERGAFELGGGVLNLGGDLVLGEEAMLAGTGQVNFVVNEARGGAAGSLLWNGTIAPGAITGDVTGALDIDGGVSIGPAGAFEVSL